MSRLNLLIFGSLLLGIAIGLMMQSIFIGAASGGGICAIGLAFMEDPG